MTERKKKMVEEGIFDIPAPSIERMEAIKKFDEKHGKIKCDNWIYADLTKVKEWASSDNIDYTGECLVYE